VIDGISVDVISGDGSGVIDADRIDALKIGVSRTGIANEAEAFTALKVESGDRARIIDTERIGSAARRRSDIERGDDSHGAADEAMGGEPGIDGNSTRNHP